MAIGAYGIINRLLTLYVMIVLGLTMGMQPIVGYNFGAQKIDRVKQTLKLGIVSGVVITSSGFFICELFPHAVSAIFTDSDHLIDLAVDGEYRIESGGGWNILTVSGGKIAVTSASCPTQDCVHHAAADHGAPIVCLPNRLVVQFSTPSELDALLG